MEEIDNTDRAIVDLLMENGRMPSAEISRRLGDVSERVVRYRIDSLVDRGVIRIGAIVNPKALGYHVVADIKVYVDSGMVREVAGNLLAFDCVAYVGCSMGDNDLGMQVVAKTNEELYRFITETIGTIEGVQKTTTMIIPVIMKDVYEWSIPEPSTVE